MWKTVQGSFNLSRDDVLRLRWFTLLIRFLVSGFVVVTITNFKKLNIHGVSTQKLNIHGLFTYVRSLVIGETTFNRSHINDTRREQ